MDSEKSVNNEEVNKDSKESAILSVPYWHEEDYFAFHLPTGNFIDLKDTNSPCVVTFGEVSQARCWWNSNLEMSTEFPVIIPAWPNDTVEKVIARFHQRLTQRYEGKFTPNLPELNLEHGLICFDKDFNVQWSAFVNPFDDKKFYAFHRDGYTEPFDSTIKRDFSKYYFNGREFV